MTDAPIRVEVVCPGCNGTGNEPLQDENGHPVYVPRGKKARACWHCGGSGDDDHTAPPGSLTEAMMLLAEAVVAYYDTLDDDDKDESEALDPHTAMHAALARVRKIKGEG